MAPVQSTDLVARLSCWYELVLDVLMRMRELESVVVMIVTRVHERLRHWADSQL